MPKGLLDQEDVVGAIVEAGGKAVPQAMNRYRLRDIRLLAPNGEPPLHMPVGEPLAASAEEEGT